MYVLELIRIGNGGFLEEGKPEYPANNISVQKREPTTNSTYIWHQRQDLNLGHNDWRQHCATPVSLHAQWQALDDITPYPIINEQHGQDLTPLNI